METKATASTPTRPARRLRIIDRATPAITGKVPAAQTRRDHSACPPSHNTMPAASPARAIQTKKRRGMRSAIGIPSQDPDTRRLDSLAIGTIRTFNNPSGACAHFNYFDTLCRKRNLNVGIRTQRRARRARHRRGHRQQLRRSCAWARSKERARAGGPERAADFGQFVQADVAEFGLAEPKVAKTELWRPPPYGALSAITPERTARSACSAQHNCMHPTPLLRGTA